jgi:hypothetical protein
MRVAAPKEMGANPKMIITKRKKELRGLDVSISMITLHKKAHLHSSARSAELVTGRFISEKFLVLCNLYWQSGIKAQA